MQAVEAAQQRRLTGAGKPQQHQHLASVDVERDIVEGERVAEPLGDVADGDHDVIAGDRVVGVGAAHGSGLALLGSRDLADLAHPVVGGVVDRDHPHARSSVIRQWSPSQKPSAAITLPLAFSVKIALSLSMASAPSASLAANTDPAIISDFHTVFRSPGARSPFWTMVSSTMLSKAKPASQSPFLIDSAEAS